MVPLAVLVACIDPTAYGATADDGKDDAPAIQKAIEAAVGKGAEVCLGPGVWDLDRGSAPKQFGSLTIKDPVVIRGAGRKTVLRMHGDGSHREWHGLDIIGAHDVVLRDFSIDGLEATDTREQTHLVQIGAGSHDVLITDVNFGPMRRPDQKVGQGIGGDCLRLLGEQGREVSDVTVVFSKFTDCDRSGIGFQRGLARIVVKHDEITGTGDAPIDFEPSGRGAIVDVFMYDLAIHRTPDAQGPYAITIGGMKNDLAQRIVLSHSLLDGGGVGIIDADGVELDGNTIVQGGSKPTATINIIRKVANVRVVHNTITRPAAIKAGPLFHVEHNNGEIPHDIVIEDNHLRQETDAPIIRWISASHLAVRHNVIDYTASDDAMPIVDVSAVSSDVDDVTITDNTITGTASSLLRVHPRDHKIGTIELRKNAIGKVKRTMDCGGAAASVAQVTLDDDANKAGACKDVAVRIK